MKKRIFQYFACFAFIVLIVFAFLAIKNYKKPNNVIVKSSALIKENTSDYKEELKVYLDSNVKNDEYAICYSNHNECGKEYLNIKTVSKKAYLIDNYKYKYFFYIDEDKVKVFDASILESYVIDGLDASYTTDFIIDNNDNLIGVVFTEDTNEHASYLLVYSDEVIYRDKYDYIASISPKYLTANKYDSTGKQTGSYIIPAYKEDKPIISKEFTTDEYYGFFDLGKKYITFEYDNKLEIYNSDTLELIYKTNIFGSIYASGNPRFLFSVDGDDNLYIYNDKYLNMLDSKGKVIKKSSKEIDGIDLIDGYVINNDNNEISIIDIDNNINKISMNNNSKLDYYDYRKINNKRGIVFYILDSSVNYKDVYNSCKNDDCKGLNLEEFEIKYKDSIGYEYFYDFDTSKVSKKYSLIIHTDEEE